MTHSPIRCVPLGDRALTVVLGDRIDPETSRRVSALAVAVDAARPAGVIDIVPAYTTIGIWYDPAAIGYEALAGEILARAQALGPGAPPPPSEGKRVVIPVRYDGPDLAEVAERTKLPEAEVIRRHAGREYRVYLVGFVPGFAFLGELDPGLVIPRRAEPRKRVPAGSVAIAGAQTGVYPLATPGGWHLIGRTEVVLFDPTRDPGALLTLGDRVRFEPIP